MVLRLLVIIALIAFAVWVYYEVTAAREGRLPRAPRPTRPVPRQRPRRHRRLPDAEIEAHVRALKQAVDGGAVTLDEAVSSLVRKCGLPEGEARRRLR